METKSQNPIQFDDHPREMVLAFDKKALEDAKPRKFNSGFEIFKVSSQLYRILVGDGFFTEANKVVSPNINDRFFNVVDPKNAALLSKLATERVNRGGLDNNLRQFYKYLIYFCSYSIENDTGFIFDF
jgi:hypothetical protein